MRSSAEVQDEGQGSVRASPSSSPEGPAAPHAALIPINVTSLDHSTRELALAAQRYAKAGSLPACTVPAHR